jgi:hypothetical protein
MCKALHWWTLNRGINLHQTRASLSTNHISEFP